MEYLITSRSMLVAIRSIPFIVWQVASLVVLIILIYMLTYGAQRKKVYGMVFVAMVVCSCIAAEYYERGQRWLKIISEQVPVSMGPGKEYPRLSPLQRDDIVRVIEARGPWLLVEDSNRKGWIENENSLAFVDFDKA